MTPRQSALWSNRSRRPRYVRRGDGETALVRACLQLLRLRGVCAWRQNQGAMKQTGADGRERYIRFAGVKGIADVIGIWPEDGRLICIEAKCGRNDLTPDQRAFLEMVRANGGVALVIRDVSELDEALGKISRNPDRRLIEKSTGREMHK